MAGHSHWAGIKHKKGRADKERSKIFSKLSREITVAARLGENDPDMNPRLRAAIQAAKAANMPKDNIARAISKSEGSKEKNYENIFYNVMYIDPCYECFRKQLRNQDRRIRHDEIRCCRDHFRYIM